MLTNGNLQRLRDANRNGDLPFVSTRTISALYEVAGGGDALHAALVRVRGEVDAAIADGVRILILSDRGTTPTLAPIPSLLVTGSVHHHLIRTRQRFKVGLVIEAGDVREVHHFCLLLGYGAGAINPWLALDSVAELVERGVVTTKDATYAEKQLRQGRGQGNS